MNIREIREQIEVLDSLPAIPPVVKKLLQSIDSPTLSIHEVGNTIAKDQALTAKLLKMVNSPMYGFPGRISSVSQALILLGLNVVKGLLLSVSVYEVMEQAMVGLRSCLLPVRRGLFWRLRPLLRLLLQWSVPTDLP